MNDDVAIDPTSAEAIRSKHDLMRGTEKGLFTYHTSYELPASANQLAKVYTGPLPTIPGVYYLVVVAKGVPPVLVPEGHVLPWVLGYAMAQGGDLYKEFTYWPGMVQ